MLRRLHLCATTQGDSSPAAFVLPSPSADAPAAGTLLHHSPAQPPSLRLYAVFCEAPLHNLQAPPSKHCIGAMQRPHRRGMHDRGRNTRTQVTSAGVPYVAVSKRLARTSGCEPETRGGRAKSKSADLQNCSAATNARYANVRRLTVLIVPVDARLVPTRLQPPRRSHAKNHRRGRRPLRCLIPTRLHLPCTCPLPPTTCHLCAGSCTHERTGLPTSSRQSCCRSPPSSVGTGMQLANTNEVAGPRGLQYRVITARICCHDACTRQRSSWEQRPAWRLQPCSRACGAASGRCGTPQSST
jgi:hypothetical protein